MVNTDDRSQSRVGTEPGARALARAEPEARPDETPHAFLRRVSRNWHDGVEAAFERFDLRTVEGLSGFLLRQAMALLPLEAAIEAGGVGTLLPDWPRRSRKALLLADLRELGLHPPAGDEAPDLPTSMALLGALYVLEGSKLGGRVLLRRALESPDPRVRAATCFLGHRHDRGWTSFLAILDRSPRDDISLGSLARGAQAAFRRFQAAAEAGDITQGNEASTCSGRYLQVHA